MVRFFSLLAILQFVDGCFSFYFLSIHATTEDNPVFSWLWELNPFVFLGTKLLISFVIVYIGIVLNEKKISNLLVSCLLWSGIATFSFIIVVQTYILTLL